MSTRGARWLAQAAAEIAEDPITPPEIEQREAEPIPPARCPLVEALSLRSLLALAEVGGCTIQRLLDVGRGRYA